MPGLYAVLLTPFRLCLYNASGPSSKAKPLKINKLALSLCQPPWLSRFGLGDAPDPGPAAGEEDRKWMTSSTGSPKSWPTRSPLL